jgi:putative transposase
MSVTRACGLIGISRSLYGYQSKRPDDGPLKERLCDLVAQKRRYGYRRLYVLLLREGIKVNRKRTYRVYREAGLAARRRKRKRIAEIERILAPDTPGTECLLEHGFCFGWPCRRKTAAVFKHLR